jgi:hypothetical protein
VALTGGDFLPHLCPLVNEQECFVESEARVRCVGCECLVRLFFVTPRGEPFAIPQKSGGTCNVLHCPFYQQSNVLQLHIHLHDTV